MSSWSREGGVATKTTSVASADSRAGRMMRFISITVLTAGLGQILIYAFFAGLGWRAVAANGVAASIVVLISFGLSVRFVWTAAASPVERRQQGLVFLAMSLLGLVISTITVASTAAVWEHDLAANVGSVFGYGTAWVIRFAVLETYVFNSEHTGRLEA